MKGPRICELGIEHLEHVFSPTGLPLPVKGKNDIGATSILVRGGAGTGKTTLALALAHSIARASNGSALYLATEFSPEEISFKATLLGLPDSMVDRWPGQSDLESGAILVEHLSQVGGGDQILSSAERRVRSIEAVWELLHPASDDSPDSTNKPASSRERPVRVVVIDALTLPEPGATDGAQRADLVAFVQTLEADGCTVILIEELAEGAHAWSAFVVDVVFDLTLAPHRETGELRRKLTVSKSRYSVSTPGPHDYGLSSGRPVVWPNPLRVVAGNPEQEMSALRKMEPLSIWIPAPTEHNWMKISSSVVLTQRHADGDQALRVLERTPGAKIVSVHCGVSASISFEQTRVKVFDHEGVQAIVWAVAGLAGGNVCHVTGMSGLIAREGAVSASHMLSALSGLGYLVCVYEPQPEVITPDILAMVDFVWSDNANSRVIHPQPRRSFCLSQHMGKPYAEDWKGDDRRPWFHYLCGDTWQAGLAALRAVSQPQKPAQPMQMLWTALCAELVGNGEAKQYLESNVPGDYEKFVIDPLCRALARDGEISRMGEILEKFCSESQLPQWMAERAGAEALTASPKRSVLLDAALRLEGLSKRSDIPARDRGEICFNAATVRGQLGQGVQMARLMKHAHELNPTVGSSDPADY